jgi:molecular chaperone GrpE
MVAAEGAAETLPAAEERLTPVEAGASLEELQRERDEYYDRLLRKAAEFENYRKRTDRERREQADAAAADLLKELLPIVDNLERALQAELGGSGVDAYRRGVELIHKQLTDLLGRHGVTPIDAVGQDFDPRYHQAVIHEASDRHRNGEVMAELRRGYKLGERLLRPAMVKVAKA